MSRGRSLLSGVLLACLLAALFAEFRHLLPFPGLVPLPPPVPGEGQHLLIVSESETGLNREQSALLLSADFRGELQQRGISFRLWDPDVEITEAESWHARALALPRDRDPWIVISNGRSGLSAPLPATAEEIRSLIGRYLE
jgi:hypothetical protein